MPFVKVAARVADPDQEMNRVAGSVFRISIRNQLLKLLFNLENRMRISEYFLIQYIFHIFGFFFSRAIPTCKQFKFNLSDEKIKGLTFF
jgi:hypothetical protein